MLPIGSIIYLKEGSRKIMILNRGPVIEENNENVFFDYSGCSYPLGLNIDEIFYLMKKTLIRYYLKDFLMRTKKDLMNYIQMIRFVIRFIQSER